MAASMRSVLRLALLLLLSATLAAQASAFPLPQQSEGETAVASVQPNLVLRRAKRFFLPSSKHCGLGGGFGSGHNQGQGLGHGFGSGHNGGRGSSYGHAQPIYKPYNNFFQPESTNHQEYSHNYHPYG